MTYRSLSSQGQGGSIGEGRETGPRQSARVVRAARRTHARQSPIQRDDGFRARAAPEPSIMCPCADGAPLIAEGLTPAWPPYMLAPPYIPWAVLAAGPRAGERGEGQGKRGGL